MRISIIQTVSGCVRSVFQRSNRSCHDRILMQPIPWLQAGDGSEISFGVVSPTSPMLRYVGRMRLRSTDLPAMFAPSIAFWCWNATTSSAFRRKQAISRWTSGVWATSRNLCQIQGGYRGVWQHGLYRVQCISNCLWIWIDWYESRQTVTHTLSRSTGISGVGMVTVAMPGFEPAPKTYCFAQVIERSGLW